MTEQSIAGVVAVLLRALDSFQGDVQAGVIEHVDPEDLDRAREFLAHVTIAENTVHTGSRASTEEIISEYGHLFNNTGGNDPRDLLSRLNSNERLAQTNVPVLVMAACQQAQLELIQTLLEKGLLQEKTDWVQFAKDMLDGSPGALARHLPEGLALDMRVAIAHTQPHEHLVGDEPVGHHRLSYLTMSARIPDVTCGLLEPHERHQWVEGQLRFPCPGTPSSRM